MRINYSCKFLPSWGCLVSLLKTSDHWIGTTGLTRVTSLTCRTESHAHWKVRRVGYFSTRNRTSLNCSRPSTPSVNVFTINLFQETGSHVKCHARQSQAFLSTLFRSDIVFRSEQIKKIYMGREGVLVFYPNLQHKNPVYTLLVWQTVTSVVAK